MKEFLTTLRTFADAQGYADLSPLIARAEADIGVPEAIDIAMSAALIAEGADWINDKRQAAAARALASAVWTVVETGLVQGELLMNAAHNALEACA